MANNNKIEKDAVYTVGLYLNKCPKLDHIINTNDKTPIYDGNIYAYNDENHKIDNYFATVPLQVKGSTSTKSYYRIAREYIEGYKKDKGCIFFLVQEKIQPAKVLYAILTLTDLDLLLQQATKTIRIDLNEVPTDPKKFETEIFAFAATRNEEKAAHSSPKEIAKLVEGFEEIRDYLEEIEDNDTKFDLETLLDSIKNTKDNGTIGWRDKFIYYSRKALDLATNNLKSHNFINLQHNFGLYLFYQKQYHLAEYYYLKSLEEYRKRNDIANIATTLNNLGELHRVLAHYKEAEQEYYEALEIRRELAKTKRRAFIADVAATLNNLGALHCNLTCYKEAEQECQEALEIYRELSETNRDAYIGDLARTLNNLAGIRCYLIQYEDAERDFQESLKIYRELSGTNRDTYIRDVAATLDNLAVLHYYLTRYDEAEQEYKEALKIRRELANSNRDAYIGDVAITLNNLANLHKDLSRYDEAEQEYKEALDIYRELSEKNRDAYIGDLAATLNDLSKLHKILNRLEKAEREYQEAQKISREFAKKYPEAYIVRAARSLDNLERWIQKEEKRLKEEIAAANEEILNRCKEMANIYPQKWNKDLEDAQRLLDELQKPNPPA